MANQLDKMSLSFISISPKLKKQIKKSHKRAKRREGKKLIPSLYNRYNGHIA